MKRALLYLTCLFAGAFYYVIFSATAAGRTGLTLMAAVPIVLAILLAGAGTGLALFAPRAAAWSAAGFSGAIILYIVALVLDDPSDAWALLAAVPGVCTLAAAFVAREERGSTARWPHIIPIAALAFVPAALAAWLIIPLIGRLI